MSNLYASADQFEKRFTNDLSLDASDRADIIGILGAVSRSVDSFLERTFYEKLATVYKDGNGSSGMWIPDNLAITSLGLDEDEDGTYEVTLVENTDFHAIRRGHSDPYGALPRTWLALKFNGQRTAFLPVPKLMKIVGTWGFPSTLESVSTVQSNPQTAGATTLTVAATSAYSVGETLKIGSEQQYVKSIDSATVLGVDRGVNGTVAAEHALGVAISRYVFDSRVREATLIQAGRVYGRRQTNYSAAIVANPATGQIELTDGLDPDVKILLTSLKRLT